MEGRLQFDYGRLQSAIAGLRAKQVFFIGAMPKSGTTWLQRMLDTHPEVSCTGEAHFANAMMPRLRKTLEQHNAFMKYKSEVALEGLGATLAFGEEHLLYLAASAIALLLDASCRGRAVRAVGDKTPDNLGYIAGLSTMFPNAKFIVLVRDPRDCAISAWFHNTRIGSPEFHQKFPAMGPFVDFVAGQWAKAVALTIQMGQTRGGRIFVLRYEDLLDAPEKWLGLVFEFLGVPATPSMIGDCIAQGRFETMTGGRAAGTEERGAFLRKGTAGDWRNHLDDAARERVEKIAGKAMALMRYS